MKALVIGASGQVGGALMQALERSGIQSVGTHYSRNADSTVQLDITNIDEVRKCIGEIGPELIFLTVNIPGGVDFCESHPDGARKLNLQGTENIAALCAETSAQLVYYSTDYIFDGEAGPYSEEDRPCPINVYGQTKWEAEEAVRKLAPGALLLRTTAVISWSTVSRNFAMQVWQNLQAGKPMRVPNDQWGNPTLAEYLAEASVRLVQMGAQGTFNVVGKDRITRSDLAISLARAMALDPKLILPVPTSELTQKARRPLCGGLRTEKLQQVLGTEPLDLNESLKRFKRTWRADTRVSYTPATVSSEAEQLKREILEKVKAYFAKVHNPQQFVPHKSRLNYAGRVFGAEEMVNLVDSALDFWLTLGPYGDEFEQKMKRFWGVRDFALVNSGSAANLTAILALMSHELENPLRPGDEVITPAVTFPTTLAPIVHGGMIPVFVDCEVGTYNIAPQLIEGAISEKTRAIVIPHTLGNPCDMDMICDIAKRHSLYLVEDCCDALGSTFRGKLVGTFGDIATLSCYPPHHITMGEGGGVAVNTARLARIVRSVRDWGRDCWCAPGESNTCGRRFGWQLGDLPWGYDHKYTYSNLGYNFKPTDMQAAVGVAQLDRLPGFVEARRRNFARLYQGLERFQDNLVLPTLDGRSDPSWFGFAITVKNDLSRNELVQWLENSKIETRQIFAGNILKQPAYQNIPHRVCGTLAETDRIMRDTFFIGVYPGLTDEMIDFTLGCFGEFFRKLGGQRTFAGAEPAPAPLSGGGRS